MSFINRLLSGLALLGLTSLATAASVPAGTQSSLMSMLPIFVIMIALLYFVSIRPQNKRRKEQASLLESVKVGDEVSTIGGIVGKVIKLNEQYIVLNISGNTELTLQKSAVSSILPKGSIDTI
jgi:preprotein translocase subunit YajC